MARNPVSALRLAGVILATALAGGEAFAQSAGAPASEALAAVSAREAAAPCNPLDVVPLAQLSATRDRPLFTPSRRPPAPPAPPVVAAPSPAAAAPAATAESEAPPFALVGTIIGQSDRIAIFVNASSKLATRLREGEQDSGWTLRAIDPRAAVFEANGRRVTLDLAAADAPTGPTLPDPGAQ